MRFGYHCFSLSLRDVGLILATRGIVVSYERIREWGLRFGRLFANSLKRRRPRPDDNCSCGPGTASRLGGRRSLGRSAIPGVRRWGRSSHLG